MAGQESRSTIGDARSVVCFTIFLVCAVLITAHGMTTYPLVDHWDVSFWVVPIGTLVVWTSLFLSYRRRLVPGEELVSANSFAAYFATSVVNVMFVLGAFHVLNGRFDAGEPRRVHATVTEKTVYRSRGSVSHALILKSTILPGHDEYRLVVTDRFFDRVTVGSRILVEIKPGYLHREWIAKYHVAD